MGTQGFKMEKGDARSYYFFLFENMWGEDIEFIRIKENKRDMTFI